MALVMQASESGWAGYSPFSPETGPGGQSNDRLASVFSSSTCAGELWHRVPSNVPGRKTRRRPHVLVEIAFFTLSEKQGPER